MFVTQADPGLAAYLATRSMITPRKADRLSSQCSNHSLVRVRGNSTNKHMLLKPNQPHKGQLDHNQLHQL